LFNIQLRPEAANMPLPIQNLHTIDAEGPYVVEKNVDIPLLTASLDFGNGIGLIRANVYRPKDSLVDGKKYPVLVTYGPCMTQSIYIFL
jgi:hypothetical protein